jgi:hypothetical protein
LTASAAHPLRRKTRRACLAALLLAAPWAVPGPRAAGDPTSYPIRLLFPAQPGSRRLVRRRSTRTLERTLQKAGKPLHREKTIESFEFEGEIEILAVDAGGGESRLRIRVRRYLATPDRGRPADVLPPGTIVLAERRGPDTVYRAAAGAAPLPEAALKLLPARSRRPGRPPGSTTRSSPRPAPAPWAPPGRGTRRCSCASSAAWTPA